MGSSHECHRLDVSCAGTEAIARAAPDGYTVGMATPGPITVAKGLIPNPGYDPSTISRRSILKNETARWARVVKVANIKIQ